MCSGTGSLCSWPVFPSVVHPPEPPWGGASREGLGLATQKGRGWGGTNHARDPVRFSTQIGSVLTIAKSDAMIRWGFEVWSFDKAGRLRIGQFLNTLLLCPLPSGV